MRAVTCLRMIISHVILGATHCFDRTLLDTVIEENTNPIDKIEQSVLIAAASIHRYEARALLPLLLAVHTT